MNRKLIILLAIIILVPFVVAYDLGDFPKFIEKSVVNTIVVIGDSANNFDLQSGVSIIKSYDDCAYLNFSNNTLPKSASGKVGVNPPGFSRCRSAATTLATSILDLSAQNLISVGGPCANNITAQIMGIPTSWPECAEGFENGTGRISLYNNWNKTQLVVAGFSAEDTKKAAELLTNYNESYLNGYEIKTTNSKITKFERVITDKDTYCSKDEDCMLVFAGCRTYGSPCGQISITNPDVIAVNRENYKCPPRPQGVAYIQCIGMIDYDPLKDAVCIQNKCEKIGGCPPEYVTHIDCMPSPEHVSKYCYPKIREWVQKNCNLYYTD